MGASSMREVWFRKNMKVMNRIHGNALENGGVEVV
jgi:hypothetical protein